MPSGQAGTLREVIRAATATLTQAGVASPRADAELLAAHAAGVDRSRLAVLELSGHRLPDADAARYHELIAARARRVPLQHLTGTAAFGPVTLQVGPGVFVPRPETEALLEWAYGVLEHAGPSPVVVDLCTGSGALALALAERHPGAAVVAVDDSAEALEYTRCNAAGTGIRIHRADVTAAGLLPELDGRVDLLVQPAVHPGGRCLEPEVADHDPHHALFGGPDGMSVIPAVAALAGRWLVPAGPSASSTTTPPPTRRWRCCAAPGFR
ncbi:N5-glutamine methyltransferase family protein [Mycolicibacterium fallax]|uniref:N5-glutamine methyltransferase family protein n=1 Tax=Mycolicibacterium fallax TaxID=1793 RepID=UPI00138B237C|nr:release factor glutamine methyltransferase [Mycolicibacterium fallax]